MATIQHTTEILVGGTYRITWAGLENGDVGTPVRAPDYADKDVQVTGTFGAGGAVTIQGSLDGEVTWASLADPQGNVLVVSAASIEKIQETTASVRPNVTAGDVTTSLTVVMVISLDNVSS